MEARLRAEADELPTVRFPDEIVALEKNPDVAAIIDSQRLTFEARRKSADTEIASLKDGISAIRERIDGANAQTAAVRQQVALLEEEIESKKTLLATGLVRRPEVLVLQRTHANLIGEIGRLKGELGDAKERISRTNEQISGVRKAAVKTAVEQLHEVLAELTDVRERIRSAQGVLDRVRISAPVKGVVVKLRYHTSGGVIEAGKTIMEILPLKEELIIEVRVRPQDIDHVKRGQEAMIRLTALNRRVTPMASGKVIYVSADALPNEKSGTPQNASDIYVARVELDAVAASAIKDFHATPGMPAEVYIKTSDRTFLEYVARPLRDSMARAFREP
jgi:HlyD family secretion protein